MKKSIQGNITVRISDDEMSAYLDFTPSQILLEWSDDLILKKLKDAGVVKGFKQYHFSRIYDKIKNKDESDSILIASGVEPQSSELSKYNILYKPMVKSLDETYETLSSENSKPNVYAVVDDYFLNDDLETKPLVILNYFYIDEGEKVLQIDIESIPKSGFTVTGKTLQPPKNSGIMFCLSSNLKIDKNTGAVTTKESGFIRIGKEWIDLIPFKAHYFSISHSDDFAEYYLSFKPGNSNAPQPTYDDIVELFSDIDYPLEQLKSEKIINQFIHKALIANKSVKFSLTQPKKALMKIDINQSKTKATLILEKGAGPGERLSLKDIGGLIRESKIKGMNLDSVKQKILKFYKSRNLKLEYTILEGKTATRGEARKLKYQKEFISVDKIEGVVNRIDKDVEAFYPSFKHFSTDDISSGLLVKQGFEFAILTDPIPGDDGTDIYGNKIKGLVG